MTLGNTYTYAIFGDNGLFIASGEGHEIGSLSMKGQHCIKAL